MRTPFLLALCLSAVSLPAPAGALDLTGTWEQTASVTCHGMDSAGGKVKSTQHLADMPISQTGDDLLMWIPGYLMAFEGRVYAEPGGDTGQALLEKCNNDPSIRIVYRIAKVKTFPPNSKGVSGKMTTLYVYGSDLSTYTCTVNWQRTSTVDPGGTPCP